MFKLTADGADDRKAFLTDFVVAFDSSVSCLGVSSVSSGKPVAGDVTVAKLLPRKLADCCSARGISAKLLASCQRAPCLKLGNRTSGSVVSVS